MFSRIRANRVGVAMTLIEESKRAFLRKKTANLRGNGGVRAGKYLDDEPPRASIGGVYDCYRFCCGGFLGAEPARASILDGEPPLASGLAQVRGVPFLLRGIFG